MNPTTALNGLQVRVRDLLLADPYFAAATILAADDESLDDAIDQALAKLGWLIVVAIAEGHRQEDRTGFLRLRARVRVNVISNPILDPATHALSRDAMPEVIRVLEGQPGQAGGRVDNTLGLRLEMFETTPTEGLQVRVAVFSVEIPFGTPTAERQSGTPLLLEDGVHALEVA